jgi:hypothetical protein
MSCLAPTWPRLDGLDSRVVDSLQLMHCLTVRHFSPTNLVGSIAACMQLLVSHLQLSKILCHARDQRKCTFILIVDLSMRQSHISNTVEPLSIEGIDDKANKCMDDQKVLDRYTVDVHVHMNSLQGRDYGNYDNWYNITDSNHLPKQRRHLQWRAPKHSLVYPYVYPYIRRWSPSLLYFKSKLN